ncbi:MAG: TrmH family RNA methyltransferase [Patescibacteria group bacterium]
MKPSSTKPEIFVVLNDIRSVHNVGSIFRTADAAGATKIFLVGLTPTPLDRFGRSRKDFIKVSLGAEQTVSWQYEPKITPLLRKLKKDGVKIVSVEQDPKSINYKKLKSFPRTAFIFGNEVDGLSKAVLGASDVICEIPMAGQKESLNVSVTAGIILFCC